MSPQILLLLFSCAENEKVWTPPDEEVLGTNSEAHDGTFELGDPISFTASWPLELWTDDDESPSNPMRHWTDVAIHNDEYAVQVGMSGATLVSRENGEFIFDSSLTDYMYRVDSDGQLIVAGSRTKEVNFWKVINAKLQLITQLDQDGTHEDVAVDDGIVAVTWREQGLKLYQSDGELITIIPVDDAFAVDIFEECLVYSDKNQLILLDISNPSSPQELDRIEMAGEGRDLAFNGKFVAAGLGGNGVATYKVKNGQFVEHDEFMFDGTALSVALDGEYLWTATWNSVWVSWLSDEQAVHLGQEDPIFSAMGVDAQGGKAIVADWYQSSVMQLNAGLWGPEVSLPTQIYFSATESETIPIPIPNYSSQELVIDFSPSSALSMNVESVRVAPGKTEYVRVTTPPPPAQNCQISWSSNDPDEPYDQIRLFASDIAVGNEHPDFNLPLVTADDGIIGNARLSDYRGKVLFLVWWSDY